MLSEQQETIVDKSINPFANLPRISEGLIFASGREVPVGPNATRAMQRAHEMMLGMQDRGIAAGIRAAIETGADTTAVIGRIEAAVDKIKNQYESRIDAIEASLHERAVHDAVGKLGESEGAGVPIDREYSTAFASYTHRGAIDAEAVLKTANTSGERASIQASMSEGDNSSGGYLAPVEWDRKIQKAQRALSPMRRISQVMITGRAAYSTLWSNDQFGSGWVGETASRPQTTANTFSTLAFPAGEIYAMPAATQRLLDDSVIDLGAWLGSNLADEFSRQEGIAFVSGDGANKPMGFLQYLPGGAASAAILDGGGAVVTPATSGAHPGGNLSITATGDAALIRVDSLVDLKYGLGAPYRQNATWVLNSSTAAVVAKLKDGMGNFIWRESLMMSEPATLLGRPVEIDENMPNVAANAVPIAFGDFQRGYLVNDRVGVRVLRDPYTSKPFVLFYATKRVGGGVLDPRAIRVLKVSVS